MDLNILCAGLLGFLFLGYLLLEGFVYGAGVLLPGRTEEERQMLILTIAPFRDGHEVWLVGAGAVLLAAFPIVYAVVLSSLYLVLLCLLSALLLRSLAVELRNKSTAPGWRRFCDWSILTGSVAPAFLWGVLIAGLLQGLPVNAAQHSPGVNFSILSFYTIIAGVTFVLVFTVHGAAFLTQRLDKNTAQKVVGRGLKTYRYAVAAAVVFVVLTIYQAPQKLPAGILGMLLLLALLQGRRCLGRGAYLPALWAGSLAVIALAGTIFLGMFPRLVMSAAEPVFSLDIYNSAASPFALKIISRTILIALPVLLLCQIWKAASFGRLCPAVLAKQQDRQMLGLHHKKLRRLIAIAEMLEDTLETVSKAIRTGEGRIRLNPCSRALLNGRPRKFMRRMKNEQALPDERRNS